MTTEYRRAPRRRVVNIERVGRWGKLEYLHTLDCGHTESRKRAARTEDIACAWCLRTETRDQDIRSLTGGQATPLIAYEDGPSLADEETRMEKVKSTLAARLGIPVDAVGLVVEDVAGALVVKNCVVYLSAADVTRLTLPR